MQTISKLSRYVALLVMALITLSPGAVLAEGGSNSGTGSSPKPTTSESSNKNIASDSKRTEFCTNLGSVIKKVEGEKDKKVENRKANEDTREKNRNSRQEDYKNKLAETRSKWDKARDTEFTKLNDLAKTDAQKAAVTAFEATMKSAIALRREAHDKANADFKTSVDAAIAGQKSGTDESLATLKSSIQAAVDKAKTSCSGGASMDSVKTQLKADIETARKVYKDARAGDVKLSDQIKAFQATRKSAVEAANSAFKSTAESARATLKLAFGEVDSTPTPTATP